MTGTTTPRTRRTGAPAARRTTTGQAPKPPSKPRTQSQSKPARSSATKPTQNKRAPKKQAQNKPKAPARKPATNDATFRRRRIVVLVLALGLVAGLVFGVKALIGALTPDEAAVPTIGVAQNPVSKVSNPNVPPTESQLANPVGCAAGAVTLTVEMPAASLPSATAAKVATTVTNSGNVPCLLDVGSAQLVVTIFSGEDQVWSSVDCATATPRRILLDIDAQDAASLAWPGTRSAEGCPASPGAALPGTYRAVATLLDADDGATIVESEVVFTLT